MYGWADNSKGWAAELTHVLTYVHRVTPPLFQAFSGSGVWGEVGCPVSCIFIFIFRLFKALCSHHAPHSCALVEAHPPTSMWLTHVHVWVGGEGRRALRYGVPEISLFYFRLSIPASSSSSSKQASHLNFGDFTGFLRIFESAGTLV